MSTGQTKDDKVGKLIPRLVTDSPILKGYEDGTFQDALSAYLIKQINETVQSTLGDFTEDFLKEYVTSVFFDDDLSPTEQRFLFLLKIFPMEAGETYEKLAQRYHMTRRQVEYGFERLRTKGYIRKSLNEDNQRVEIELIRTDELDDVKTSYPTQSPCGGTQSPCTPTQSTCTQSSDFIGTDLALLKANSNNIIATNLTLLKANSNNTIATDQIETKVKVDSLKPFGEVGEEVKTSDNFLADLEALSAALESETFKLPTRSTETTSATLSLISPDQEKPKPKVLTLRDRIFAWREQFDANDLILVDATLSGLRGYRKNGKISESLEYDWVEFLHQSYQGEFRYNGATHKIDKDTWRSAVKQINFKLEEKYFHKTDGVMNYLKVVMISISSRKGNSGISSPNRATAPTGGKPHQEKGFTSRDEWKEIFKQAGALDES